MYNIIPNHFNYLWVLAGELSQQYTVDRRHKGGDDLFTKEVPP
jgi:hypothetical protein